MLSKIRVDLYKKNVKFFINLMSKNFFKSGATSET